MDVNWSSTSWNLKENPKHICLPLYLKLSILKRKVQKGGLTSELIKYKLSKWDQIRPFVRSLSTVGKIVQINEEKRKKKKKVLHIKIYKSISGENKITKWVFRTFREDSWRIWCEKFRKYRFIFKRFLLKWSLLESSVNHIINHLLFVFLSLTVFILSRASKEEVFVVIHFDRVCSIMLNILKKCSFHNASKYAYWH